MLQRSLLFRRLVLLVLLWGVTFALDSARAAEAPTFVLRNPTPQGTTLNGVTFANNRFVAVGNAGLVLTSTDGATWHVAATLQGTLNAVAFGGGQWVAVGSGGRIFTSPDAFNWTTRSSPTTQELNAVTYASSQYLAGGAAGTLLTSPDGTTWTARASGTTQPLQGIAGRTGAHVAVGPANTLLLSTDGITWTPHTLAEPAAELTAAAILNNQFVVVGRSARIYTSPDGVTWTSRATGGATYQNITYDGTQYIISSSTGYFIPTVNFTNRPLIDTTFNPRVPRYGITFGNGVTVAVGWGGDIATSTDGRTWVQRGSSGADWKIDSIASLNGRWFAGTPGSSYYSSADGVTWSRSTLPGIATSDLWGWAYGANRYVVAGTAGLVASSADGVTWSGNTTSSGVTRSLAGVTFGNGRFVAVGDGGVVTTSADGLAWTPRTSGVTSNLNAVVTFGNRYIVVGDAGVILTSSDGATWTRSNYTGGKNLSVLGIFAGAVYAGGSNGTIIASTDGQSWTVRKTDSAAYVGIVPAPGGLLAVIGGGTGSFSSDGITWSTLALPGGTGGFTAAGSDGSSAMVAGLGGAILQSVDPAAPPSRVINVATRGLVQPGGALTPGFVLRGTGSKQVVVRAIGPTLSSFGLNGLSDLKLDVVNQQTSAVAATNDDWGGTAALATRFASLGAFALGATSKDAAVQASLPVNSGGYSVRITAAGTASTGVALAEVYDGDADDSPVRVINVSTLGFVGTNEDVLTPGFVIRGSVPKRLLIRAIGPGLAPLGVTGLLADPQFSLFASSSSVALATSNDWGGTAELKAAFTAAGAFSIPDTSRDAAVVVTLPAGAYTVVASGVGNTTGTAIVEVYDLDP